VFYPFCFAQCGFTQVTPGLDLNSELSFTHKTNEPDNLDGFANDTAWWEEFARPVTNLRFDHPFIFSELRPLFIHHNFPENSALGGGNLRVYTSSFQLRVHDKISIVALKAGFVDFNPSNLPNDEGWADLAAGLKFNLWNDAINRCAVSLGTVYEAHQGTRDISQGGSGGIVDLYLTTAKACGNLHLITTAGFDLPVDRSEDVTNFHYHAHLDYSINEIFAPLVELNGYHYMDNADRTNANFECFDYSSLGSNNVKNNDVVTAAVGFRLKLMDNVKFGTAYEWSVSGREDAFEDRITCDLSLLF
jgi:hypothetical protein